jgi:predicted ATPase
MVRPLNPTRRVVLTGAPGTGKTTILDAVRHRVATVPEPARRVLAEERATGGNAVWDRDPGAFAQRLLEVAVGDHGAHTTGMALFDRGVPDCIAYARAAGIDTAPFVAAAQRHRYERSVLVLPPWDEIYTTDDERTATFAMIEEFHDWIVDAYETTGYRLVALPKVDAAHRTRLVLDHLGLDDPDVRRPRSPGTS